MSIRSKYHHVFIKEEKNQFWFTGIKTQPAGESNHCAVNSTKFVFTAPGNKVGILDISKPGKIGSDVSYIQAHSSKVVDVQFSPFNDNILLTSSLDGTASLWNVGKLEKGIYQTQKDALTSLNGHTKKLGVTKFHPTAENVVLTTSLDKTVKLWDLESGEEKISITFPKEPVWADFNATGDRIIVTCKDKHVYLLDPRAEEPIIAKAKAVGSMRGFRCKFLNDDLFIIVGFDGSDRIIKLYDVNDISKPLDEKEVGSGSGVMMIHYDEDLGLLYLCCKGEGSVFYYDINEEKKLNQISSMSSNNPFSGAAFSPKIGLNTLEHQIGKIFKMGKNNVITMTINFPRKIKGFQKDLFPNTNGNKAKHTSEEFFGGAELEPLEKISLAPGERPEGGAVQEIKEFKKKDAKKLKKRENTALIGREELAKLVVELYNKLKKHEDLEIEYFFKQ